MVQMIQKVKRTLPSTPVPSPPAPFPRGCVLLILPEAPGDHRSTRGNTGSYTCFLLLTLELGDGFLIKKKSRCKGHLETLET